MTIIIAAIIIAFGMVLSAMIISFSMEGNDISKKTSMNPFITGMDELLKKKEMAEIIKRGDPIDEFLKKNDTQKS